MNPIDERAASNGIAPIEPAARLFAPFQTLGNMVVTSGHTSDLRGVLGVELGIDEGRAAAREAIVRLLSSVLTGNGTLAGMRFASMRVYVKSDPGFEDQPTIADAASELVLRVFGTERGAHSRSAIGVAALPRGVAVEIEAVLLCD